MSEIDKINLMCEKTVDGKLTVDVIEVDEINFPQGKMKEIIRGYFGGNVSFGGNDDYCEASMAFHAMNDFLGWYLKQQQLIKESNEA